MRLLAAVAFYCPFRPKKKETAKAHKNTANMSDGFNNAHV